MATERTRQVLREELAGAGRLRERLREAMRSGTSQEVVTNLLQVELDAVTEQVLVVYLVVDPAYPPLRLTYRELGSLLAEG